MAAFRFSRRAESDLLSIGDYTLRTWGKAQAARYLGELEVCCQTLSDNPGLGRLCDPLLQMASGIHFSLFASFAFGTPEFPVAEVPLQEIVDRVAKGIYKAKPAAVFTFEEIREAQRLMESCRANGKITVKVTATGTNLASA